MNISFLSERKHNWASALAQLQPLSRRHKGRLGALSFCSWPINSETILPTKVGVTYGVPAALKSETESRW
jgi:hypothetical protein